MNENSIILASFVISILCGSIPFAFIAGKIKGIDIRQHGSGNVGATNAFRVLGKKIGSLVFLADFLKGFLPVFILKNYYLTHSSKLLFLFIGASAILGHVFTPFLGFKGGKGIATGAGVLAGSFPMLFVIVIGSWILSFTLTRIVSVSSIIGVAVLLLSAIFFREPIGVILFFLCVLLFFLWTHRLNIYRLIRGQEKPL